MTKKPTFYLFDFDGTLVPDTRYVNDITNVISYLTFKTYINPSAFEDIHWAILTARPYVDKSMIEIVMRNNNLYPEFIITQPKSQKEVITNPEEVLKIKLSYINMIKDERSVVYVDNDQKMLDRMLNCGVRAINIIDFLKEKLSLDNQNKSKKMIDLLKIRIY